MTHDAQSLSAAHFHMANRILSHRVGNVSSMITLLSKFSKGKWQFHWNWRSVGVRSGWRVKWSLQAATIDKLRTWENRGHHHFLARMGRRYCPNILYGRSSPPISRLKWEMSTQAVGCFTQAIPTPVQRLAVWIGSREWWFPATDTSALSYHLGTLTMSSHR